jgi:hypothetical protein
VGATTEKETGTSPFEGGFYRSYIVYMERHTGSYGEDIQEEWPFEMSINARGWVQRDTSISESPTKEKR